MKLWKKGLTVASAAILAASLPLYSEAASNVTVSGKVFPKAGVSLNFDAVEFSGTFGDATTPSTYKKAGTSVTTPQITVRHKDNFNVGVKSSAFSGQDAGGNAVTLDTTRITVASEGTPVKLTAAAQDVLTGSGDGTAAKSVVKPLNITLNLAETGFSDEGTIGSLSSEVNLSATITVSFNGL